MFPRSALIEELRRLLAPGTAGEQTDAWLLQRFAADRDEAAFAELLRRHGPLVWNVCQRLLGDVQAAEDAFQATFLVLVRKAGTLARPERLGPWLYGVAHRTARKAKATAARQRRHESEHRPMTSDPHTPEDAAETRRLVHDLIDQLPEKYRVPVVLCYLQGRTCEEASRQLAWPIGTVMGRLARARELLRQRLGRRGYALSAAALAALLAEETTAAAAVPPAVAQTALSVALHFAAGEITAGAVPASVTLTHKVLRTMFLHRIAIVATIALPLTLAGVAAGVLCYSGKEAGPPTAAAPDVLALNEPASSADAFGDPLPTGVRARLGTTRWWHRAPIVFLAYLDRNEEILTVSQDRVVHIWETATGKEKRRFGPKPETETQDEGLGRNTVALSPDCRTLAMLEGDRGISFWDVATGKQVRRWEQPKTARGMWAMTFSPDGTLLAVKGGDQFIRIYKAEDGNQISSLGGGTAYFGIHGGNSMVFTPDGKHIVCQANNGRGGDHSIRRYDVATGKELQRIQGPPNRTGYNDFILTADCTKLAWSGNDCVLHVSELLPQQRELFRLQQGLERPHPITFSSDGTTLILRDAPYRGGLTQVLVAWEAATGKELWRADALDTGGGGNQGVYAYDAKNYAFTSDGKQLAAGSVGDIVRQWRMDSGKELIQRGGHDGPVITIGMSSDGRTIVTRSGGMVRVWNAATGRETRRFQLAEANVPRHVFLSADARTMVAASREGLVELWDPMAGKKVDQWQFGGADDKGKTVRQLALSADGKTVAIRTDDPAIYLLDARSGRQLQTYSETPAPPPQNTGKGGGFGTPIQPGPGPLVFSADGSMLASQPYPEPGPWGRFTRWRDINHIRVIDVATGRLLRKIDPGNGAIAALSIAPDGRALGIAGRDGAVAVWEIASGRERLRASLKPIKDGVLALSYTPDGSALLVAGADAAVRLVDTSSGQEIHSLKGHAGAVACLALSADGKTLATGSADTTALVHDLTSLIRPVKRQPADIDAARGDELWKALAGDDAHAAFHAIETLAGARQAVQLLAQRLKPIEPPDAKKLAGLIADLRDDQAFAVRQRATEELERLGELASDALKQELAGKPSLETQKRVERLLQRLEDSSAPTGELLRGHRALEVLQRIGTPEARRLVEMVARGAPAARLTHDARVTLQRLAK